MWKKLNKLSLSILVTMPIATFAVSCNEGTKSENPIADFLTDAVPYDQAKNDREPLDVQDKFSYEIVDLIDDTKALKLIVDFSAENFDPITSTYSINPSSSIGVNMIETMKGLYSEVDSLQFFHKNRYHDTYVSMFVSQRVLPSFSASMEAGSEVVAESVFFDDINLELGWFQPDISKVILPSFVETIQEAGEREFGRINWTIDENKVVTENEFSSLSNDMRRHDWLENDIAQHFAGNFEVQSATTLDNFWTPGFNITDELTAKNWDVDNILFMVDYDLENLEAIIHSHQAEEIIFEISAPVNEMYFMFENEDMKIYEQTSDHFTSLRISMIRTVTPEFWLPPEIS